MLRMISLIGLIAVSSVSLAIAQTPSIEVQHAWARATPAGAKTAALYMTLVNKGPTADRLLSAATPVAGKAELHTTIDSNGVMQMRPVAALDVQPGTPTVLKPGGYHLMLMGLKGPLAEGQHFTVALTFEKAGTVEATVEVEKVGAMGPDSMPGMKM